MATKGRLLFIMQYMMDHTDDTHVISTSDLINACVERGYNADRHTINDDISELNEAGIEFSLNARER